MPSPFDRKILSHSNQASRAIWKARHFGVFSGRSLREELFADQTPAHVLTDHKEYLADLVGACGVRA